jgi:3-hydroxybutyryl-CoA dehydrogenase
MAKAGFIAVGIEVDEDRLAKADKSLHRSVERAVERGKLEAAAAEELLGRVQLTTQLADLGDCDLIIEAVPESTRLKSSLWASIDPLAKPEAIFASNTSSLSITSLAVATSRPAQFVGVHFFNPAPVRELVEVVKTVVTNPDVIEAILHVVDKIGKQPVLVGDRAGFIANTLLLGYLNQAAKMYEQKYASREDIDAAMRLGCGYPLGPLALLDLIGLDTAYKILDTMHSQTSDRLHAPAPILKQMVTAGMLGRKSGRGFYTYEGPGSPVVVADDLTPIDGDGADLVHPVKKVAIYGSGTMAAGIVEVFVKGGFHTTVIARSDVKADALVAAVKKSLQRQVEKGRLELEAADAALAHITTGTDDSAIADADLVLDAVAEDIDIKLDLFSRFDKVAKDGAVLATTTSSLPVVELAAATSRPESVVGLHFFNPAPVMKLVEVVTTVSTAPDVTATALAVSRGLGKTPVLCGDRAGFIVNYLLFPYLNDAVRMLQEHYATADDIDKAMKLGCALPMGPFELLDVVGLDVSLAIQRRLFEEFREPSFAPAMMLEQLVTAGYLGRKAGRGFRVYA